jgi:predicted RNA-binding Zn ribbon-like protein
VAEPQPGGRAPAPGQLALVQDFANSFWDLKRRGPEQLKSPGELAEWLQKRGLLRRGVRLGEADLRRAREVRAGIRALLFANAGAPVDPTALARLNCALQGTCLSVRLRADLLPEFVPANRDFTGALAAIAGATAVAQLEGRFRRLKACPGPDCGWAFYDGSRNLAGTWCAMSICGSRVKAREYRRRRRA